MRFTRADRTAMIHEYYGERTLLITGGTGFLGQALIAKVLRDLPQVKRIYALIRPGRGARDEADSAQARMDQLLATASVFSDFRRADPDAFANAAAKIVAVSWDLTRPNLGIGDRDREKLRAEVDTMFNSAATVVFDEPLDQSLEINAHGPRALFAFAQSCSKQVDFIHVSTAYVSGQRVGPVAEELLPPDRSIRQIPHPGAGPEYNLESEIAACEAYCRTVYKEGKGQARSDEFRQAILKQKRTARLSDARLQKLTEDRRKRWIEGRLVEEGMRRAKEHGWNDVYTMTKAMGEQLLVKHRGDHPLVIVRPSIIESSLADPEPGWITGLKVMDPLVAAYGRGMLPDFPARPDLALDIIPVDIVVNATLAAATRANVADVPVLHVATSSRNPVTIAQLFDCMMRYFKENPLRDGDGNAPRLPQWSFPSVGAFRLKLHLRYLLPLRLHAWVLSRLPASMAPPQKRRLLSSLRIRLQRLLYYADIYHPYTHLRCTFETAQARSLHASLPKSEQQTFNMDVDRIDWDRYIGDIHLPGLRRHVLKDQSDAGEIFREAPEEMGAEEERWREEERIETIPDLLRWACARYPGNIAFQMSQGGRWQRLSYAELLVAVEQQAALWQQMGLEPGQRVLLYAGNSPQWVIAYMAASTLGLTVVPVDPQTRADEVWNLAAFTAAQALMTSPASYFAIADTVVADGYRPSFLLNIADSGKRFQDLGSLSADTGSPSADTGSPSADTVGANAADPVTATPARTPGAVDFKPPRVSPAHDASIIFTAGMVIQPRGVRLSHANLISDLLALAEVQRVDESDRILSLLPLHHGLEFTGAMMMSLLGGATTTYLETLNSRVILGAMRSTGTTAILAVPRLLKVLLDRIDRLDQGRLDHGASATAAEENGPGETASLVARLRLVVSGGAPLAPEIFAAYQRIGVTVYEGYGLTETSPIVSVNPPGHAKPGSVGTPLPGVEVRIDRPDSRGRGEVLVRGSVVTAGYLDSPLLTSELLRDGWLYTGDMGFLDSDGYLFITGRSKDLIVTGAGKNVYPQEVEELYGELPEVVELGVVGARSTRTLSEEVHAVGVVAGDETSARIKAAAHGISRNLPTYQRIKRLHLRQRPLPRAPDGTLDRTALAADVQMLLRLTSETDIDESLAPWERAVYQLLSGITGLTTGEVLAHGEAPVETLLDSLMSVEFAAVIAGMLGHPLPRPIDRNQTLRSLIDTLEPMFSSLTDARLDLQAGSAGGAYWSRALADRVGALATGPPGRQNGRSAGRRFVSGAMWKVGGGLFRGYFSLHADGAEHLPDDRPYVLAANHASHLDAPAILLAVRSRVELISLAAAKDYFSKSALQTWFLRHMLNGVAFDRDEEFLHSLLTLREQIDVRRPLLVFPEGTRSASGRMMPFKTGVGLLAFELDLPIVPVHVSGTHEALPRSKRFPQRHPLRVSIGPPLEMQAYKTRSERLGTYEVYREIVEAVRRSIEHLGAASGGREGN